jgi:hypothetical protein
MSARVIPMFSAEVHRAREIVGWPEAFPDAVVLDACEVLEELGTRSDRRRALDLKASIIGEAVSELNRKGRALRVLQVVGDVVGVSMIFLLGYLFLIFTPN